MAENDVKQDNTMVVPVKSLQTLRDNYEQQQYALEQDLKEKQSKISNIQFNIGACKGAIQAIDAAIQASINNSKLPKN